MMKPDDFESNLEFSIGNEVKALVVDLSGVKDPDFELTKLTSGDKTQTFGLSLVPSKKITKNDDFLSNLANLNTKLEIIYIDEDLLDLENFNIASFTCNVFMTLSNKVEPRDYEAKFYQYSRAGVSGINFDIETVTKGHLALCTKFNLKSCVHSINFERQLESAEQLGMPLVLL